MNYQYFRNYQYVKENHLLDVRQIGVIGQRCFL